MKECKPWSGDVIEEAVKSTNSSKTVGFSDTRGEMAEVEPRPVREEDSESPMAQDESAHPDSPPSDGSELGEEEAYDEEQSGEVIDDE